MAEEVVKTKTDPTEMSARQKWQRDMSAQLGEQTAGQSQFTDTMKNMMGGFKTDEALAQQTKMSGLLTTVQSNTFKTANLLEGYIDFMKDAERKRLEAAMEAARLKDKKDKDKGALTVASKGDDLGGGLGGLAAGLAAALGAGILAFKEKWGNMFSLFGNDLDEFGKPKATFFSKIKKFLGFGDDAADIKNLGKAKVGFFAKLGSWLGFKSSLPKDLAKSKTSFVDDIAKFFRFEKDAPGKLLKNQKKFMASHAAMLNWAKGTDKMSDASKLKFFKTQANMLKWLDKAEGLTDAKKADFLKKQSKMLEWVAKNTKGIDASKMKFIKGQSKMLEWAAENMDASKSQKLKFLKKHANILDIGDDIMDKSKIAKGSFLEKQLKMLGLSPADVDGVKLKKESMFSKLKTKIFNIGDDVVKGVSNLKNSFSTKMTKFLTFPAIDEGSSLGKFKKLFFTSMDNMLGTLLKITKGFFKLVNVLSFNALGFLDAEALKHPIETFKKFKASIGAAFGKEGAFGKIANTFKAIMAPFETWMKPIKGILKYVKIIGKLIGKIFIPIGFLFAAFDVISNVMKGYEEGGITGAIGAGIESIFDDVLFIIPNLLGEAVAWLLKKFGFKNAVKFIDENLRDSDGNFSLFTGIKRLFSALMDAVNEIWTKVMKFMSIDNILTMIGAKLYKSNMPGSDSMANALLSEKYEKRAKLRAKSEEEYQQLVEKETRQADLLANKNNKGTVNQQANDNSQQTVVNNMSTTVKPETEVKQDSYGKKKLARFSSDIRLKENIQLIEEGKDGNPNIYSFNYKEDKNTKWKGVMAQELIGTELSDAVITDAKGFYMVDYTRLGFPMIEIKE